MPDKTKGYKMQQKKRKRRSRRIRRLQRDIYLLGIVLLLILIIMGVVQLIMKSYIHRHDDGKILSGITVGGVDVSGQTKDEAVQTVQGVISQENNVTFTFKVADDRAFDVEANTLGLQVSKLEDSVQQAADYGRRGNALKAYKIMKNAKRGKLTHDIPLQYKIDENTAKKALETASVPALNEPQNACVTQDASGNVSIEKEKSGEVLNTNKTIENIKKLLKTWDGKNATIQAKIDENKAKVTAEELKDVTDLLGSSTTYYDVNDSGRAQNVESGAKHLNDILLQPGEEQSADEAMRPYTEENGYAEAASFSGNTVEQTMGGGICQVSTTLYQALLHAELDIVERHQHSMLVSYAEPSMDAAIADDVMDLVFKNNQEYPVYIEAIVGGGSLTFNIYGKETRDPNRTVTYVSETLSSEQATGTNYVASDDPIGYINYVSAAHPKISAQLWKVVTENGTEVSREVVNHSEYVSSPETYSVGTASDDANATAKMQQAIGTQDLATINAAIQEIIYGY